MTAASDLPESWPNQEAMIRALVSYIPCDKRVRQAVADQFGKLPSSLEVKRLREQSDRKRNTSQNEYSTTGPAIEPRNDAISSQRRHDRAFIKRLLACHPERRMPA